MLNQIVRCLLILAFMSTLHRTAVAEDHPRLPDLAELRNQVIKLETELSAIQRSADKDRTSVELGARIDLAEARGRLVLAEGRPDDAIQEFTDVVAGRELAASRFLKGGCPNVEGWQHIRKEVAFARARLAEVKGDPDRMAAELQEALTIQENEVEMYARLLQCGACKPEDVTAAQKELTNIRFRLDRAKRLIHQKEMRDGGIS